MDTTDSERIAALALQVGAKRRGSRFLLDAEQLGSIRVTLGVGKLDRYWGRMSRGNRHH